MARDTLATLAALAGSRLKSGGELLVTAESCTGGWVAQSVTAIAGSSDWFERGFVTYSNDSKQELLGVRAETLARSGAGSCRRSSSRTKRSAPHSHLAGECPAWD